MSYSASPGNESYQAAMDRIKKILQEDGDDLAEINKLSDASFREWLNAKSEKIARDLGIAIAKVKAYIADLAAVASNAVTSFKDGFSEGYNEARKVQKRPRK